MQVIKRRSQWVTEYKKPMGRILEEETVVTWAPGKGCLDKEADTGKYSHESKASRMPRSWLRLC